MRKKKLFSICICVITTALIIGVSGCNKQSDEGNISESVEHTAANKPSNDVEEKSNDMGKTSNYETISTPYIIDTVAKADIIDIYSYSQDKEDNIYYIDNNCIYKVNAYGGTANKVLDAKDIISDNSRMSISDFQITSVSYDNNTNKLFMTCRNGNNTTNNSCLYSVYNNNTELIYDKFKSDDALVKILNNGDYIIGPRESIINSQSFEETNIVCDCIDVFDNNTELNMVSQYAFHKYNYIEETTEWNTFAGGCPVGINDTYVVGATEDSFILCDFAGETKETRLFSDSTILDRTKIDSNEFENKLLLTSKNDIVFYDKTAKAFRIIKKNDTTVGLSADNTQ